MNNYDKRALDLALGAGSILLECGAEIFRVEETIRRIAGHFGIDHSNPFILSSAIFLTAENSIQQMYSKIRHIPLSGVQLNKVDAVNRLSRGIVEGIYTLEEAEQRLVEIRRMPGKKNLTRILASGLGAGCFCFIIKGHLADCLASFLAGCILYIFLVLMEKRERQTSKLILNLLGAFLATASGMGFYHLGLGTDYGLVAVGAIMPLLPGVSFVNSIRDFANGDYIAGTIRLMDTLMVTFGIALGVGGFFIFYHFLGGVLLP